MKDERLQCSECGVIVFSYDAFINHVDTIHRTGASIHDMDNVQLVIIERRQSMQKPGQCWHLVHKQKLQQCGLDARRYIVRRPCRGDGITDKNISMGPCVVMWLCINHIESVKKQGYLVVLDTQAV